MRPHLWIWKHAQSPDYEHLFLLIFLPCPLDVLCCLQFPKFDGLSHYCVFVRVVLFPWNVSPLPHVTLFFIIFWGLSQASPSCKLSFGIASFQPQSSMWSLLFIDHSITVVTGIANMYLFVSWCFVSLLKAKLLSSAWHSKHLLNEWMRFLPFLDTFYLGEKLTRTSQIWSHKSKS